MDEEFKESVISAMRREGKLRELAESLKQMSDLAASTSRPRVHLELNGGVGFWLSLEEVREFIAALEEAGGQ